MWERGEKGGVGGRGVEEEREWRRALEEEGTGEEGGRQGGWEDEPRSEAESLRKRCVCVSRRGLSGVLWLWLLLDNYFWLLQPLGVIVG